MIRKPVYLVYGFAFLALIVFVVSVLPSSRPYPYSDEWIYTLPFSFRSLGDYLQWAFAQHVDHRIPIQKLLQFFLLYACGFDFRYLIGLNYVLAVLLSLLLVGAAAVYRGHHSFGDLIIPLTCLSFCTGLSLWGFQFQFLSSNLFIACFLFLAITYDRSRKPYCANSAVVCLLLCALCGINGMVMSSAISLALFAYLVIEQFSGQSQHRVSTYVLLAVCVALNVLLWKSWSPSGAASLQHFDPTQFWTFLYWLVPAGFSDFWFTYDWRWWKFALVVALLSCAFAIVLSKSFRRNITLSDFALVLTIGATFLLILSIALGRQTSEGGRSAALGMHYAYLTIFLPLVSWILISGRLSSRYSSVLAILLVIVFARAFQANASRRYETMRATASHQAEVSQQLATTKDIANLVDQNILEFMWKDAPPYRQAVIDGISALRRQGIKRYGPPPTGEHVLSEPE
jgi:hypothetical protein